MVKLNRIYTRTGDDGSTGLVDGSRVSKADPRIAAMGDVDEANCAIGMALPLVDPALASELSRIQNDLFDLGADLATPDGIDGALRVTAAQVDRLERAIDRMNGDVPSLTSFVLPAGDNGASALHMARAVTRRAERSMIAAGATGAAARYVNRLSDFLFVAARWVNRNASGDVLWVPGATRDV